MNVKNVKKKTILLTSSPWGPGAPIGPASPGIPCNEETQHFSLTKLDKQTSNSCLSLQIIVVYDANKNKRDLEYSQSLSSIS